MGVKGLETHMREIKKISREGWKKTVIEGPLVVDGNQFCHRLYLFLSSEKLQLLDGGRYVDFYEYVRKIIHKLKQCNIEAHFIFDGIDKPKKLSRDERKVKVKSSDQLPELVYIVLYNALKDMNIPMYVADGEGDLLSAQVANYLQCPVLSCNSNFFLFDIPAGYIDIQAFFSDILFDPRSLCVPPVEAFYRDSFLEHHSLGDKFFLFPSIIGSGVHDATGRYIEPESFWDAKKVNDYMKKMYPDSWFDDLPEEVQENLMIVRDYYNDPKENKKNPTDLYVEPIPKSNDLQPSLPEWFHKSYRKRDISFMVFDALINRTQHHGTSTFSERIRQCCYSVLRINEVTEYRCDSKSKEVHEKIIRSTPLRLSLQQIESQEDSEKKITFYSAMHCTDYRSQLDGMSSCFFVSTVIFWNRQTRPPQHVLKAMIATFVRLSQMANRQEIFQLSRATKVYRIDLRNRQSIKKWQCVYRDAVALSQLVRYPPSVPCPSLIFDETLVLSLAGQWETIDEAVRRFISSGQLMDNYKKILGLIGIQ